VNNIVGSNIYIFFWGRNREEFMIFTKPLLFGNLLILQILMSIDLCYKSPHFNNLIMSKTNEIKA